MPTPSTDAAGGHGPLSGLRVLDLSRILAGPFATQILGDLGADVIKVERPGVGDDTRAWGPPFLKDADGRDTAESGYYLSANRNKRSLTLDLAHADGQDVTRRLAACSDVLIENFRVDGLRRLGLAYEQLRADNPRLIYCSITGFGQTGPYAARAGYDFLAQGMGGVMSVTGEAEGGPVKVGVAIADIMAGMYGAVAILAALHHRQATGEGQYIDIGLLDTSVEWLANQGMNYLLSGQAPGRMGNAHPNIAPYQVFATADGHVIVAAGNDAQFARLCAALGASELAQDERFRSSARRVRHRQALTAELRPLLTGRTTRDWLANLQAADVPCGPVNAIDQVFADEQVRARGMQIAMSHPATGESLPLIGSPLNLSATPVAYRRPPPMLGEHSDEILRELLRMDAGAIADLRARGII